MFVSLLVRVGGGGQIFGLEKDLKFMRDSEDLVLNMLSSLVIDKIGVEFSNQLETQIELVNGLIICVVNVSKSTNPAFLSGTGGSEFFVRVFNTSRRLDSEQTMNYLENNIA